MDRFAEKIGAWLLRDGNTKKQLSDALGISVSTLNNRLAGEYEWTWNEVRKLADVIGCSLDEFL